MDVNSKGKQTLDNSDEINIFPILTELLKKLWIIILSAVIVGGIFFAGSKFLVVPTYRASFSAYINNRSQLSNGQETLSNSDLTAAQQLVRAYSETIMSRNVLSASAQYIKLDLSYEELKDMVSTQENDTQIITVYVVDTSPDGAYNLATSIASVAPDQISNIIEGSSMRVIDMPQMPKKVYKPSYIKNTLVGILLGGIISAAFIIIRFLLDDKVKNESELEARFSLPVVGVIPDMLATGKGGHNYYDYEYAYRYSNMKRSKGSDGKEK